MEQLLKPRCPTLPSPPEHVLTSTTEHEIQGMNCKDNGPLSSAAGSDEHQTTPCTSSEMQAQHLPTTVSTTHPPAEGEHEHRHKCMVCETTFTRLSSLKRHTKIHKEGCSNRDQTKRKQCNRCIVCEKVFKRRQDLKQHMTIHTGVCSDRAKRQRERRYKCMVCNKGFKSPRTVKEHMNIHTGVCNFPCEICGKKYYVSQSLKAHMVTHSAARPNQCELCPSTFKKPSGLKKHLLAVHEGIRRKKCNDCNRYYYPFLGSDERHARRYHVGEDYRIDAKPFKCSLCDARFKERWYISVHIDVVHSDERPFLCTVCGKAFKTNFVLQAHSAVHMEAEAVRTECKVCQKMVRRTSMSTHMKSHGEKEFLCNTCGKQFCTKSQLKTHEKSHLGVRAHACELCDKRFTLPHQLRAHRKTHSESTKSK
ncbi:zinc finger protein 888-like [Haliotis cracherodii]|uniref:zinc finger protein 888-like n=1 Tax=Haliotis cracherodii TaxID=6455 RepID=UPI0039E89B94